MKRHSVIGGAWWGHVEIGVDVSKRFPPGSFGHGGLRSPQNKTDHCTKVDTERLKAWDSDIVPEPTVTDRELLTKRKHTKQKQLSSAWEPGISQAHDSPNEPCKA